MDRSRWVVIRSICADHVCRTTASRIALSEVACSGDISGPWDVDAEPVYVGNGGHAMLFRGFNGALRYILHRPGFSKDRLERVVVLNFDENGPRLVPRDESVA